MDRKHSYIKELKRSLGDRLDVQEASAPNELYLALHEDALGALPEICSLITKSFHAHFTTIVANDERAVKRKLALYYVFSVPKDDLFLIVRVPVDPRHMEVPSISTVLDSANWFEREVKD